MNVEKRAPATYTAALPRTTKVQFTPLILIGRIRTILTWLPIYPLTRRAGYEAAERN